MGPSDVMVESASLPKDVQTAIKMTIGEPLSEGVDEKADAARKGYESIRRKIMQASVEMGKDMPKAFKEVGDPGK